MCVFCAVRLVEAAGAKLSRLGQKDFINIIQQYINKNGIEVFFFFLKISYTNGYIRWEI